MIKNFIDTKAQSREGSHEGEGSYDLHEVWSSSDFQSNIDFIDRVVIPPN